MRGLMTVVLLLGWLQGAVVHESLWRSGESFSQYLARRGVPLSLLKTISAEDSKYLSEIQSGERFYELLEGKRLEEALIPIGEEMQIRIARDLKDGRYRFDIIPIVYRNVHDRVAVRIRHNCSKDIDRLTRHPGLGALLQELYRGVVDFRRLRSGDRIAFEYEQKSRLGRPFGRGRIDAALIRTGKKERFAYTDAQGTTHQGVTRSVVIRKEKEREVAYYETRRVRSGEKSAFLMPVRHVRITSGFSYKRWHPLLHRYRPHLGVDFGARRGTPIYAVADGRVVYAGWMRGYGKVVKIAHTGGYVSLYAHQSRIRVRLGERVRRGQQIGNVGSTGRSTGPHLHFGLYYHGRAINPMNLLGRRGVAPAYRTMRVRKTRRERYVQQERTTVEVPRALRARRDLRHLIRGPEHAGHRWEDFARSFLYVRDRKKYDRVAPDEEGS